jgi:O-antigen/teichoic acid export membrane protein
LTGSVGGRVISVLYIIFLAHQIGAEGLGYYVLGVTVVELVSSMCPMGLDFGIVRFISINKLKNDVGRMRGCLALSTGVTILVGLTTGISIFAIENPIATLFGKPKLGQMLSLLVIAIPFNSVMVILLAAARGLKHVQYTAIIQNFVCLGSRFAFTVVFICVFGMGLDGALFAYILSYILSSTVAFYYVNQLIPLRLKDSKMIFETKELFKFSLPMFLSILLFNVMRQIDVLMIGMFLAASQVGIYGVAARVVTLAEVVFTSFRPLFDSYVAELFYLKDIKRLSEIIKSITRLNLMVGFPSFLALTMFPGFFLIFFGEDFIVGAQCLTILSVAHLFSSLSSLPASVIVMSGRSNITVINNFVVLIIGVVLNYLLIPKYGIVGAALSTGITLMTISIIRFVEVYHLDRIIPFSRDIWKTMLATLLSIILPFAIYRSGVGLVTTAAVLFLFIATYVLLMIIFKATKNDDFVKEIIIRKFRSMVA